MTPLISPWTVYLISLCDSLSTLIQLIAISNATGWTIYGMIVALHCDSGSLLSSLEENWKPFNDLKPRLIKWIVVSVTLLIISTFIPSSQTAATMLLADNITPQTLEQIKAEALKLVTEVKKASE